LLANGGDHVRADSPARLHDCRGQLPSPRSVPGRGCETFSTFSRRPDGGPLAPLSRRRHGALAFAALAAPATAGPAPVGWRNKRRMSGPRSTGKVPGAAAGFDKGTLAMTNIGLTGAGKGQPDSPASVRVIAPCTIPPLRRCGTGASPVALCKELKCQPWFHRPNRIIVVQFLRFVG
jgi:hypothetical protein